MGWLGSLIGFGVGKSVYEETESLASGVITGVATKTVVESIPVVSGLVSDTEEVIESIFGDIF